MSDTVKLIIEISKSAYEEMSKYGTDRVDYDIQQMINRGIPLDDVLDKISAEIEERIAVYDNWQTQRECTATEANTMREALAIVKKYMESEGQND